MHQGDLQIHDRQGVLGFLGPLDNAQRRTILAIVVVKVLQEPSLLPFAGALHAVEIKVKDMQFTMVGQLKHVLFTQAIGGTFDFAAIAHGF